MLFFVLLPIRLRILWRRILRLFGRDTYEMAIDDLNDSWKITRIILGFAVAEPLREITKRIKDL